MLVGPEVMGAVSVPLAISKWRLSGVPMGLIVVPAIAVVAAVASLPTEASAIPALSTITSGPAIAISRIVAVSAPLSIRSGRKKCEQANSNYRRC